VLVSTLGLTIVEMFSKARVFDLALRVHLELE